MVRNCAKVEIVTGPGKYSVAEDCEGINPEHAILDLIRRADVEGCGDVAARRCGCRAGPRQHDADAAEDDCADDDAECKRREAYVHPSILHAHAFWLSNHVDKAGAFPHIASKRGEEYSGGMNLYTLLLAAVVINGILVLILRQVNQYEKGVFFTIGKFTGIKEPGWRLVIPIFQSMKKVDTRVKAVEVPEQKAITKDNISVGVTAVIYYRVSDVSKAILEVENYFYAVSQLAQTTMRNVVGEVELDELLAAREKISEKIRVIVDETSEGWGIMVSNVVLKDVVLPTEIERMIARQAEAEREKRAVIIKAEGEVVAATNMAKAAGILSQEQGALHLRTLQTIDDVSSDQSNTLIFALPLEVLRAFEKIGSK